MSSKTPFPGHDPETNAPADCIECASFSDHNWLLGPFLSLDSDGFCHWHHHVDQKLEHQRIRSQERAEFVAAYTADPSSFFASWFYVDSHPMFLSESVGEDGEVFEHYRTGIENVYVSVVLDDEKPGQYIMMFETGPVVEDHEGVRQQKASDWKLMVHAKDYESGIVTLAAKVASQYGHDYSERLLR